MIPTVSDSVPMFHDSTLHSNNDLDVVMTPMPTEAKSTVNFKKCQVFVGNLPPSQDVFGMLSLSLSLYIYISHTDTYLCVSYQDSL